MSRAGPPNPRSEPWRMPTPRLPEQPGRTPVPAHDAAWRAYHDAKCVNWTPRDTVIAKAAFAAGRKSVNQETEKLDEGSLFPTMGLHRDL